MLVAATAALALNAGYAPMNSAPALSSMRSARVTMAAFPSLQDARSAAVGAGLAAMLAAGPALAADPWPYSTLLGKVSADEVAKVSNARFRLLARRPKSFATQCCPP